jgi:NAD(P)-dependent dehydrogenase (short-subunit alcohol dehydrogenase family)
MISLREKVVVVTGASKGIGLAIARAFAESGSHVIWAARSKGTLTREIKRLAGADGTQLALSCDVSRKADIKKVVSSAKKRFGRIDIWVNNAGIGLYKPITETSEADYNQTLDTNLKSVFYSFKELIPLFRKQKESADGLRGHIINISSSAARIGIGNLGVYAASKAGLNLLSESVANEVRNEQIKISVLAPASTETALMRRFMKPKKGAGKGPSVAAQKLTPEEVAEATLSLAQQNSNAWTSMADIRPLSVKR